MDLTPDQHETLLNFQAITENWDPTISLQILHRNNWNLQEAINEYEAFTHHLEYFEPTLSSSVYEEPIIEPQPRRATGSFRSEPQKKSFFSKIKSVIGEIIVNPIPVYSTSIEKFKHTLESLSPGLNPVVNTLILKDVIVYSRDKKRMLAIYIQNAETSWEYTKQILCNDLTVMVLNDFYVFWPVEKESIDGEIAEHVLKPLSYPCFAVVDTSSPQPVVLEKLEGFYEVEKIISFLSRNYIPRPVITQPNKQLIQERKLRAQQERELREAEKIVEAKKIQELKEKEERRKKEEEERLKKIEEEQRIKDKMERIGTEPDGPDASFVTFRMPDGSKVERRFGKRQKVSVLYDFIETVRILKFEILFGFPALVLSDMDVTIEDAGIHPKALLIVRISDDQ